jgi:hypothetical protein
MVCLALTVLLCSAAVRTLYDSMLCVYGACTQGRVLIVLLAAAASIASRRTNCTHGARCISTSSFYMSTSVGDILVVVSLCNNHAQSIALQLCADTSVLQTNLRSQPQRCHLVTHRRTLLVVLQ